MKRRRLLLLSLLVLLAVGVVGSMAADFFVSNPYLYCSNGTFDGPNCYLNGSSTIHLNISALPVTNIYNVTNITQNIVQNTTNNITTIITNNITNNITYNVTNNITNSYTDTIYVTNNITNNVTNNITQNITNNITSLDGNNYTVSVNIVGSIFQIERYGMANLSVTLPSGTCANGYVMQNWTGSAAQCVLHDLGAGYETIIEETAELTQRQKLGFKGTAITCADNATSQATECTVTALTSYTETDPKWTGNVSLYYTAAQDDAIDGSRGNWTGNASSYNNITNDLRADVQTSFCDFRLGAGTTTCYPYFLGAAFASATSTGAATGIGNTRCRPGVVLLNRGTATLSGYTYYGDSDGHLTLRDGDHLAVGFSLNTTDPANTSTTLIGWFGSGTTTEASYNTVANITTNSSHNVLKLSVANGNIANTYNNATNYNLTTGMNYTITLDVTGSTTPNQTTLRLYQQDPTTCAGTLLATITVQNYTTSGYVFTGIKSYATTPGTKTTAISSVDYVLMTRATDQRVY